MKIVTAVILAVALVAGCASLKPVAPQWPADYNEAPSGGAE